MENDGRAAGPDIKVSERVSRMQDEDEEQGMVINSNNTVCLLISQYKQCNLA